MRNRVRLAGLIVAFVGGMSACALRGRPAVNDFQRNAAYFKLSHRALLRHVDSAGVLPDSLRQTCPSLDGALCQWLPFGYKFTDAWNRPLRYQRVAEGFELISPGRDARLGTADDVHYRPDYLTALIRRTAGCYTFSRPWSQLRPSDTLILHDASNWPREHLYAAPEIEGYWRPNWEPIGEDSILVRWTEIHNSITLRLKATGTRLSGVSALGGGAASFQGQHVRRDTVRAERVTCARPGT